MLTRNGSSGTWLSLLGVIAGCGGNTGVGIGNTDGSPDACASEVIDDNTLATFEDGFGTVLQQGTPPRNGGFYAYNGGLPGCVETPAAGTIMPAATAIEGGGRCGSLFAFRFFGSGCTDYAGVGTDLAAPLPPDGSAADAASSGGAGSDSNGDGDGGVVAQKIPYDLSGYKQVTFWGRTGTTAKPSNQTVQFKLPMLVDTKVRDGGTCVDGGLTKCSASYGRFLSFTPAWQLFTIDLVAREPGACSDTPSDICQEIWGTAFPWDPTNVVSMQFQAAASSVFDIWLDDINLVPK